MQRNESRLTVFFEDPFWVGVYERISDDRLEACKITFGSEPKDYEVWEFLLENFSSLRFSPKVEISQNQMNRVNPKRAQRVIKHQLTTHGTGTKSQQALKLQKEEGKILHREKSRMQREEEKQRQFELRQQKKKEKHRGR